MIFAKIHFLICALVVLVTTAAGTQAAFIVTIQQSGADVVASGSGSLKIPGASNSNASGSNPSIDSGTAEVDVGTGPYNLYSVGTLTGATNFGSTTDQTFFGVGTGSPVAIETLPSFGGFLQLPLAYVSGAPLSDTATWSNKTLASMNLVPGSYTEGYGSGANADSITVNIVAVPEPGTAGFILVPVVAGLLRRRR